MCYKADSKSLMSCTHLGEKTHLFASIPKKLIRNRFQKAKSKSKKKKKKKDKCRLQLTKELITPL